MFREELARANAKGYYLNYNYLLQVYKEFNISLQDKLVDIIKLVYYKNIFTYL